MKNADSAALWCLHLDWIVRDLVLRGSMMNNLQQPINSTISYIPSTSSQLQTTLSRLLMCGKTSFGASILDGECGRGSNFG